jgi:transcriptional regulator with XRE-family HTH domain
MRAGRALLGWKQTDLASAAGLALIVIKNIERGATDPRVSTINRIQEAFDRAGLVFLDDGDMRDGGPGTGRRPACGPRRHGTPVSPAS